ncbi:MAG TPA: hypothetical protein VGF46_03410 [Gaiellales bacterium]|jgi:hypothetical protein
MRPSKTTFAIAVTFGLLIIGFGYWKGPFWTLGVVLGLVLIVALLALFVAKTSSGKRAGAAVGKRVLKTRVGQRMARGQLRAEAKRRGIPTVDAIGRELTDVELQLEITDTPETRVIKRQLRTMNPQQRAQALRMLQAQSDEAQRTGVTPPQMAAPRPPRPKRPKKGR